MLYNSGGSPATATNVAIAPGGADLAFQASGTTLATAGDVRLPQGVDDTLIWSMQKRSRTGLADLGLLAIYSGSVSEDAFVIGAQPFDPNLADAAFTEGYIFVRRSVFCQLIDPAVVIAGDNPGWALRQVGVSGDVSEFAIEHVANLALPGEKEFTVATDYCGGRGNFFWGRATVKPTVGVPDAGVLAYCDPADTELYYLHPDGDIRAMRAQPAVMSWGNLALAGTTGVFGLSPGFAPATNAPSGTAVEIPAPAAGAVTSLSVLHGAPGGNANPISYTLFVGGVATAATVNLAANGVSANLSGIAVTIAQGSRLSLRASAAVDIGTSPQNILVTIGISPIIPP